MTWTLAIAIGFFAFAAGLWLGAMLRDRAWRDKAESGTRMLSGGRFFYVVPEKPHE